MEVDEPKPKPKFKPLTAANATEVYLECLHGNFEALERTSLSPHFPQAFKDAIRAFLENAPGSYAIAFIASTPEDTTELGNMLKGIPTKAWYTTFELHLAPEDGTRRGYLLSPITTSHTHFVLPNIRVNPDTNIQLLHEVAYLLSISKPIFITFNIPQDAGGVASLTKMMKEVEL